MDSISLSSGVPIRRDPPSLLAGSSLPDGEQSHRRRAGHSVQTGPLRTRVDREPCHARLVEAPGVLQKWKEQRNVTE